MTVHVRPSLLADREYISSLATRFSEFDLPDWRSADDIDRTNRLSLQKALEEPEPGAAILVADDETQGPVGFIHIQTQVDYFSGEKHGYVADVAVSKTVEGRGVGRMLLEAAEAWARSNGYRLLTLYVFSANARARRVYERYGFQPELVKYVKPVGQNSNADDLKPGRAAVQTQQAAPVASPMKRICVFCGSSPGSSPEYLRAAHELGNALVRRHVELVYGGGGVGMMAAIAQTVIRGGGKVTGVIPRDLVERGVALTGLADLRVVGSMHERKALMVELSDGFIALPGGLGTIEEFLEVVTWAQLGIHPKPCGVLNVKDYYGTLMDFLDHAVSESFVEADHRSMILVDEDSASLLRRLETYRPPLKDKAKWALGLSKEQRTRG